MTRDRPDGAALLRLARATLLEDLLPALSESRRYDALMVASAMAMAARELAAPEDRAAEQAALEALVGPSGDADIEEVIDVLLGRLASAIREGREVASPRPQTR